MLVRTWNVFHGNAYPAERRAYLEEMVRLASADEPDALCLQEVPVWALERLGDWSGMAVYGEVAAPPRIGPFPSTPELGRVLTFDHGLLRSAFTGQANAILVRPGLRASSCGAVVLNSRRFRRAAASRLGLDLVARLAWAKERRVCQAVRVEPLEGRAALLANLHATGLPDDRLSDAELLRAAEWADKLARAGELCVLAGDFNVHAARSRTLAELVGTGWGFSEPVEGLDQVLVRGASEVQTERWPVVRRRLAGRVLSDHAPVDARIQ